MPEVDCGWGGEFSDRAELGLITGGYVCWGVVSGAGLVEDADSRCGGGLVDVCGGELGRMVRSGKS